MSTCPDGVSYESVASTPDCGQASRQHVIAGCNGEQSALSRPTQRIVVHDYGGHHFPGELAQSLAKRGHEVLHLYFIQCQNPSAVRDLEAIPGYTTRGLSIAGAFQKFSWLKRRSQEIEYGRVAAKAIADFAPDVVISSTTPTDAQAVLQKTCNHMEIPFVFWLQDIISVAMGKILPKKLPVAGNAIAAFYRWQEARLLRRSQVVSISPHFLPVCAEMGVSASRCVVIENWAPLDEIVPLPRPTDWAREHGLHDKRVILYSGTLGLKHNPAIFVELCRQFADQPDVRVVVVSEGIGAQWLGERKAAERLDNLVLLPFQPYPRLSEVLASGDILMAILERDAGIFSVPSKILSYLCAGRAILVSVPLDNLAADTVRRAQAGRALAPDDVPGLIAAAKEILADEVMRDAYGSSGRRYAEATFDIDHITDKFEKVLFDQ
jgi:colanic acid biosynthesis glycosyl transferase WcaI